MASGDLGEADRDGSPAAPDPDADRPWYVRYQLHWVAVFLDAVLIFALSSRARPTDDLPPGSIFEALYEGTPGADKIVHFLSFFVFGLLTALAINMARPAKGSLSLDRNSVLAILIAVAYAATDEIHQQFVPSRTQDIADFAVDSLGAGVAIILVRWRARKVALRRTASYR